MAMPRPYLGIEGELLFAAQAALTVIDASDPRVLESYDRVAARVQQTGTSFSEAAEELRQPVTAGMLTILIFGYLFHWWKGGSEALLSVGRSSSFSPLLADDFEGKTLQMVITALVPFAMSQANNEAGLHQKYFATTGERLLALARWLDDRRHVQAARESAVLAAELLRRCNDDRAVSAGQFALRLMNQSDKCAFLPLVPRAKYPPPPVSSLPTAVVEQVVLAALTRLLLSGEPGMVSSAGEFEELIANMLADRDYVLHCPLQFSYAAGTGNIVEARITRFEMRFGTPLLQRFQNLCARTPDLTVQACVTDMLLQLVKSRAELQHRRDPHLYDWFELLGAEPYRSGALFPNVTLCVQTIGHILFVVAAEGVHDIEKWQIYERHAETTRNFLRRARADLA
jgi:hypothetical protein